MEKSLKPLCTICKSPWHYQSFCPQKPHKAISKRSDKQIKHDEWISQVARPTLIERDGNICSCCHMPPIHGEKLDVEHTKTKGSRPDLKQDLNNLTLMCRPCHRNKTDGRPCFHMIASV